MNPPNCCCSHTCRIYQIHVIPTDLQSIEINSFHCLNFWSPFRRMNWVKMFWILGLQSDILHRLNWLNLYTLCRPVQAWVCLQACSQLGASEVSTLQDTVTAYSLVPIEAAILRRAPYPLRHGIHIHIYVSVIVYKFTFFFMWQFQFLEERK